MWNIYWNKMRLLITGLISKIVWTYWKCSCCHRSRVRSHPVNMIPSITPTPKIALVMQPPKDAQVHSRKQRPKKLTCNSARLIPQWEYICLWVWFICHHPACMKGQPTWSLIDLEHWTDIYQATTSNTADHFPASVTVDRCRCTTHTIENLIIDSTSKLLKQTKRVFFVWKARTKLV